jgi:hypothetical protein
LSQHKISTNGLTVYTDFELQAFSKGARGKTLRAGFAFTLFHSTPAFLVPSSSKTFDLQKIVFLSDCTAACKLEHFEDYQTTKVAQDPSKW